MSYAIFRAKGQQFRAEPGRRVRLPLMAGEPGDEVTFDEVLVASDGTTVKTGAPTVAGAAVTGQVLGPVQADKLYVFRFKRRKNYRKKTGHRQKYTEVMITDVKLG
jgi:large subunit ribosomal protein L21